MYDATITLFNFHANTEKWYTSVFSGVNFLDTKASNATPMNGTTDGSTAEVILHTTASKAAQGKSGELQYIGPRGYAALSAPAGYYTFKPETDFFIVGDHASEPIDDNAYDEGLYHVKNAAMDEVYMITGASWFGLLPHFEIGGR